LKTFGRNIAIQGELIAPTIQQNYEKVDTFEFYIYDVFDIDKQKYLLPCDSRDVAQKLGLNYVPVLADGIRLSTFITDQADVPLIEQRDPDALKRLVDAILAYAEGPGMNNGVKREGVVFKSNKTEFSMKAISNSYLLNKKD
jgi:ATP-dependent RNA circularization protein (DNA/RNA ligase family)